LANLNASVLLIENSLFASSVHCSYYAMLQFMTCKLSAFNSVTFETITANSKGPGSHEYVIGETITHLKSSLSGLDTLKKEVERTNIHKLKGKIKDLKLLRVQSDYHNIEIDAALSDKALAFSKEIISKINTYIT